MTRALSLHARVLRAARVALAAAIVVLGVGCKHAPSPSVDPLPSGAVPVPLAPTQLATTPPLPPQLPGAKAPQSFADLAAKADPAVVFVKTLQEHGQQPPHVDRQIERRQRVRDHVGD